MTNFFLGIKKKIGIQVYNPFLSMKPNSGTASN